MEEDIKNDIRELEIEVTRCKYYGLDETAISIKVSALENILNELERLQKENEALQMTHDYDVKIIDEVKGEYVKLNKEFKAVDQECSRLEQKEIILESENEHYKDLIYALETYYDITEEDLEKCVKEDR